MLYFVITNKLIDVIQLTGCFTPEASNLQSAQRGGATIRNRTLTTSRQGRNQDSPQSLMSLGDYLKP